MRALARGVVFGGRRAGVVRVVEELGEDAVHGRVDALAEHVVSELRASLRVAEPGELIQRVVGVSRGSIEDEIAVAIVLLSDPADARVLVHRVDGVIRRRAVDDRADAIADQIVAVGQILIGDVRIGRGEDRPGQLAAGVVGIAPRAIGGRLRDHLVERIVSRVEFAIDGAAGSMIDDVQQIAVGIVAIGGECAVGVVLLGQIPDCVVTVSRNWLVRPVEQFPGAAGRVVDVIERVAALIDALGELAERVVRVCQGLAVGISDAGQRPLRVVGEGCRSVRIGRGQKVAISVVGKIVVAAVGEGFFRDVAVAVVRVINRLAVVLNDRRRFPDAVQRELFLRAVGISDGGKCARGSVR